MRRTRALVLRALGAVSLIAFVSLWVQVHGLIGSNGLLPFSDFLTSRAGRPLWQTPTLFWWWQTDIALDAACGLGVLLSGLLLLGATIQGPILLTLWALYLSLSIIGQDFLGFQWDTLLTETLFAGCFIARWRPQSAREPSPFGVWLLRLTLFKLMLGAGLVKLTSGDPSWWDGTALSYHYVTQPLPNPASRWMHSLPLEWHKIETYATLAIETILPFFLFGGRPGRYIAASGFTLLFTLLFLTGNYGFFQLLSMVLVLSLLDDALLDRLWPSAPVARKHDRAWWIDGVCAAWLVVAVGFGSAAEYGRVTAYTELNDTVLEAYKKIHPLRTINAYGLFARMTKTRPELIVEGSDDGKRWTPYAFRYKTTTLSRRPPVVAPHMPRLDWQLWFAALRSCRRSPWLHRLLVELQAGNPEVRSLLANDPFPSGPAFIRTRKMNLEFSDRPGEWWRESSPKKSHCPVLTRR